MNPHRARPWEYPVNKYQQSFFEMRSDELDTHLFKYSPTLDESSTARASNLVGFENTFLRPADAADANVFPVEMHSPRAPASPRQNATRQIGWRPARRMKWLRLAGSGLDGP